MRATPSSPKGRLLESNQQSPSKGDVVLKVSAGFDAVVGLARVEIPHFESSTNRQVLQKRNALNWINGRVSTPPPNSSAPESPRPFTFTSPFFVAAGLKSAYTSITPARSPWRDSRLL